MKKRAVSLLMALTLCLGLAVPVLAAPAETNLPDWYFQPVAWALENCVTNGTGGGRFSPGGTCTRADAVTCLWRLAGSPEVTAVSFADVPATAGYAKAVNWAAEMEDPSGISADRFAPDQICTRGQIVTFFTGRWQCNPQRVPRTHKLQRRIRL